MISSRTCKQAVELLVAREDRNLVWNDQIALRLHLAACETCPRFDK
ncbi:MAG: zf-HC2 domain-containing protein [Bdellovibrionales bacterium]|nr:zf-HC2 domain-containing protein [Ramlibacter sp.]